jgi:hypothetical protein
MHWVDDGLDVVGSLLFVGYVFSITSSAAVLATLHASLCDGDVPPRPSIAGSTECGLDEVVSVRLEFFLRVVTKVLPYLHL